MIPRVWKYFFRNLAWPVGITGYLVAVCLGAAYVEGLVAGGAFVVPMLFIALPVLSFLIREMWQDAREKVEHENRQMMNALKGNKIDY